MAWQQVVLLTGDAGPQGPTGPQGTQGIQGVKGDDGAGIAIAGSVATYAALPTGLGSQDAGDGYLVNADGKLYFWTGSSFPSNGQGVEFRGPQGPAGAQGEVGPTGATGAQGPTGATGAAGATGATGARGTLIFTGSGAPTSVPGSAAGDIYIDTTPGAVTLYKLA